MVGSNGYENLMDVKGFFNACRNQWLADQVTFRRLYTSDKDTEQARWIREHKPRESDVNYRRP